MPASAPLDPSIMARYKVGAAFRGSIDKLERTILLFALFETRPKTSGSLPFFAKRLSNPDFVPDRNEKKFDKLRPFLDDIIECLSTDRSSIILGSNKTNVRAVELLETLDFLKRTDIRVVLCDKNLGLAVVDTSLLTAAFERHLRPERFQPYSLEDAQTSLLNSVKEFNGIIDRYIDAIDTDDPKASIPLPTLRFCRADPDKVRLNKINPLAKVHKAKFDSSTWRFITQAHNSPFQRLNSFLAQVLDPMLETTKLYVRDTTHAITMLDQVRFLPSDEIVIFKVDATDLYGNLNLDRIDRALTYYLNKLKAALALRGLPALPFSSPDIIRLLRISNGNNYVQYMSRAYKQLVGIAMGRADGVQVSSLTLAFEELRILADPALRPALFIGRYIDDVFGVLVGSAQAANDIRLVYERETGLAFTIELVHSPSFTRGQSLPFLDVSVCRGSDRLYFKPYDKDTNLHLYIPPRSAHPPHVFTGWVAGNLKRLARNSSLQEDFTSAALAFYRQLRARGYSARLVNRIFESFDFPSERAKVFSNYRERQRTFDERVAEVKPRPAPSKFFFVAPYSNATKDFDFTRGLNRIQSRHGFDLRSFEQFSKFPTFSTAWSNLPTLATLVVNSLQRTFQGIPNPNPRAEAGPGE
jgi:hypothetical protein